jgi:hypothetical protein
MSHFQQLRLISSAKPAGGANFRSFWTNYWLLRDDRQVRAVVTDIREHGGVEYRYHVDGSEYTASA